MLRLTPPRMVIFSFLGAIVLGTILLALPVSMSGENRMPLVDSLFTATSATCVTGLTVRDTGSFFSPFGRCVIFILFQAGGLGIMTFSTLFAVLMGRKISFHESDVVRRTLDKKNVLGFRKLIVYILCIAAAFELIGALFLFLRWKAVTNWPFWEVVKKACFHSVSAFCNAGFSLFSTNLEQFRADPYINFTMIFLIFFGGIGFIVIMDLLGLFYRKNPVRQISLQSKVALIVSVSLIIAGAVAILFFERNNVMKLMSWPEKILGATFQSVTARTAGFNTLSIGDFSMPSLLVIIFLMFIGASPGSTGGGIKTCTFAVLTMMVFSMLKDKRRIVLFGRSVPREIIRESLVIFFLSFGWIFIFTIVVTAIGGYNPLSGDSFMKCLFEVMSAFGTVGLSTGITAGLSVFGKLCIIITMFVGRVGPLTLALAVAFRRRTERYSFPEETIMVG